MTTPDWLAAALADRYTVVREVGAGGSAIVARAQTNSMTTIRVFSVRNA